MLTVTVELWPDGDRSRAQTLAQAAIANDGTGTTAGGNYDASFWEACGSHAEIERSVRSGRVKEYPRERLTSGICFTRVDGGGYA